MTTKQRKAAERQLATMKRVRKSLESCNTAGCATLEQVNGDALKSNANCIFMLEESLRVDALNR